MNKWSEEQINKILGNESSGGDLVDIFNNPLLISIPLDSKCGSNIDHSWALYRYDYIHHTFTLEDFKDCEDEDSVWDTFSDVIRYDVKVNLV